MSTALKYKILSGDTYAAIASNLATCKGVTLTDIEAANPETPASSLRVDQVITVPAKGTQQPGLRYTILPGDSYWSISQGVVASVGVSAEDIAKANPDTPASSLAIGQVISIPAAASHPAPAPSPGPSPTPAPSPTAVGASNIGYWAKTWEHQTAPAGTTLGLAFSGWTDPNEAIPQAHAICGRLTGDKYITFGGGNEKGAFTKDWLSKIDSVIQSGQLSAYQGIAYDVEEGDSGLSAAFQTSFATAKAKGLFVLVTISHSAPYGIHDAPTLMESFFADPNIDFLSPQLYTRGNETANDWATTDGVTWNSYAKAKAKIIPSIVHASLYTEAQSTLATHGVSTAGYVVWAC
ncbi:LysM peptidoglycan-binding domain-containing protein [Rhodospirillum sp. A1_3_36]|uniref:LysM peptidoglycan-binding domain-containing protein n=1 Tax=Rhodospirillum sp. A1_3_36 TaxID=3391666 RepID=UPI0039A41375